MLSWSESDPEWTVSAEQVTALAGDLASQMSDEQYESKIAALLTRAYEGDKAFGNGLKELWRDAYSKLNEGDHYIAIMLDQALSRTLRKKWSLWS